MRSGSIRFPFYGLVLGMALFGALLGLISASAVPEGKRRTGEQVYRQQCAGCHGIKGEGSKHYPKPLTGSQSVGQLARFIAQSMPPGPRKCTGEDARKVAAYIYDAFYSPLAQERGRPARIELSRLTVGQYRNAVADLVGSFRAPSPSDERRGLRGEYYKAGRSGRQRPILERVDPEIRFDFGTGGALPEQDDPYQFAMRWEGSVIAPDTGEYEFIVRTEHAVRLWVNDPRRPLIDALVKSGDSNEHRASLFLLGGRAYPLQLEFSKGVQGVNDLKKLKEKPPAPASLMLAWQPPKRSMEVIPQRCLLPVTSPQTFVVATPFPPDDRSRGFERGSSISKAWDEAATEAAIETARYVVANLAELSGAADGAKDRPERVRAFCKRFVERAFRRPLTQEVEQTYVERQFQSAPDLESAVKRVVLLTLKSPRFLYREIGGGKSDPYAVASRLSFGLWDSLPDQELLKAAAEGALSTREQVVRQAERMVADPRAWHKVRGFFLQWLKVDHSPDLVKSPTQFPGFDAAMAADLRTSLELFLEQMVWGEKSDFRQLLLTDRLPLNGRLARTYGANLPPDAPFQWVSLDPAERAGVLTHPYLMASLAYLDASSPIHRGVLISRNLLGRMLQPPPEAVAPLAPDLHPNLTTRQRVALQTRPAACMSCHNQINPLGFTLEKFDAIGRLRNTEKGKPVDSSGSYRTRSGQVVKFSGARDLARFLAGSEEAHAAFIERLFHHLVKQPIRAFGPRTLPQLQRAFQANGFNIRKELVEIVTISALNG